jgi:hypothetical protein
LDAAATDALLAERWPAVAEFLTKKGQDATRDFWRDERVAYVRLLARARVWKAPDGTETELRDPYVFRLDFADYDEHAPRIDVCDPTNPVNGAKGRKFYPRIDGNGVFGNGDFLCMPGDRNCYEKSGHAEWRKAEHYHPEVVIESLHNILNLPGYAGRANVD